MKYGLTNKDLAHITKALALIPEIRSGVLFGSRAKGDNKKGSDVDLAIKGEKLTQDSALKLQDILEEQMPLPYFFDVVIYDEIDNKNLKEHIDRRGEEIYRRKL